MTYRPRLEQLYVFWKASIPEGVNEMDAKTVVLEQKITDTENENFLGRRRNASPGMLFRNHV